MRRFTVFAISLCAVIAVSRCALAWDDEGHAIVALIADHSLTPAAKTKVQAMLQADVDPMTRPRSGKRGELAWTFSYKGKSDAIA